MKLLKSWWFRGISIVLVASMVAGLLVMLSPRVRIETTTGMVSISFGTPVLANPDTTGEKPPTLGESVSEAPWSDNTWTTPTNIYADNGGTASITATSYDSPDQSSVLKATGFDFSVIPDTATIDGVIVRVNTWYANGTVSIDLAQLLNTSKVRVGDNWYATPSALTTNTADIKTSGNSTSTWGNALTPAWVKNANFGVGLGFLATGTNSDVFVDYVTIEIYYTPPSDPAITVSPTSYNFGVVAAGSSTNTTTIYFTIDNTSAMQTDQTISVTTSTWSGGNGWNHNDSGTPGDNATAILANRGGTWGTGDVIVKNAAPNFIYENCPANTDYSFGLGLWTPLTFYDGAEKTITVRISAVVG